MILMMKSHFYWWRKSEHPEETTDLRQIKQNNTYRPCRVLVPKPGRSGVKHGDLYYCNDLGLRRRSRGTGGRVLPGIFLGCRPPKVLIAIFGGGVLKLSAFNLLIKIVHTVPK